MSLTYRQKQTKILLSDSDLWPETSEWVWPNLQTASQSKVMFISGCQSPYSVASCFVLAERGGVDSCRPLKKCLPETEFSCQTAAC